MKTNHIIKEKVDVRKLIITLAILLIVLNFSGSLNHLHAQTGSQDINILPRNTERHNDEECVYIVVNEQGLTLRKIAHKYSIDLTTLNSFNRNLIGQTIKRGSKVYYPVDSLNQGIQCPVQDTAKYDYKIIRDGSIRTVHNVNPSNLNLIDREYAIRKIDHQIKIPSRKIITSDGVRKTIQGEAMQVQFDFMAGKGIVVFENDPLLRYNKEIGKYKGSYNLILLDTTRVSPGNYLIPYKVPEIQLNFYSYFSEFQPEPFKFDSANVYKQIEITEGVNTNNPLQLTIKTPLDSQQFFVRKEPIVKIETSHQKVTGNGPQSVDLAIRLYAYDGSDNVRILLSTTHGKLSENHAYLDKTSIANIKLSSTESGKAIITAEATAHASIVQKDVKTIDFEITRTGIELSLPTRPIQRDDYQYYNIDVSLPHFNGIDSVLVSLKSDFGELSDNSLFVKRDESKTINLKSKKQGNAKLKATSEGLDSDEKQMIFTEGPPKIVFNPKDLVVIDAFGLEKKEVIVSLQNYIGDEEVSVSLSIEKAKVSPLMVILKPANSFSQIVTVESKLICNTTLNASAINRLDVACGELSFKLRFPLLFIVFISAGGSIGTLVKYYMKPQKAKLITSLIYGCLTGLFVTIMVLFLGLKLPFIDLADDKNNISGVIVFGLSLFGSIFWEPIYSSMTRHLTNWPK